MTYDFDSGDHAALRLFSGSCQGWYQAPNSIS